MTYVVIPDLIRNPGFSVQTGSQFLCNGFLLEFIPHCDAGQE
jgi:hypothetical protein